MIGLSNYVRTVALGAEDVNRRSSLSRREPLRCGWARPSASAETTPVDAASAVVTLVCAAISRVAGTRVRTMLEQPVRDRRAERHQATKEEILSAGWDLVRSEGLAALSLRDLARAVGMKAPSLYSYFDSKFAIFDAMFAQGARAFLAEQAEVPSTGDSLTDLRAQMRFFVRFCTDDPARYQLMFQRTMPGFEPSQETYAVAVEGLERLRARLVRMGLGDQRSIDLLTALGTGLADQQISNDPGGDRWIGLIDDAVAMFFTHVTTTVARRPKSRRQR